MSSRPPKRPPPDEGRRRLRFRRIKGDQRTPSDEAFARSPAGEQERLIAEALADLRDMAVREVMTPRVDVVSLTIPVRAGDVVRAVRESGHRCFPVVHDDLDDLVGLLYVTDLFRSRLLGRFGGDSEDRAQGPDETKGREVVPSTLDISRRLRQPYLVPESSGVLDALADMRHRRRAFAVVVDEYGGVSGVLTIKDLLEPLVGNLNDEFDLAEDDQAMVRVDGSRWLVGGRVSVDDVNERLHLEVPEGEYVTLAGFLLDGLGRVPEVGATLTFGQWSLKVVEMDKRRIVKVLVQRTGTAEGHLGAGGTGSEGAAGQQAGEPGERDTLAPAQSGTPATFASGTPRSAE